LEAEELLAFVEGFQDDVLQWLKRQHPGLLKAG
jgi:hypothetical protein